MFPIVDNVSETFLGERFTSIFFEVYVSSQTACARRIGPGLIARMIESAKSSSFSGRLAVAFWTSWESLGRVLRCRTRTLWWLRFWFFGVWACSFLLRIWRLTVRCF